MKTHYINPTMMVDEVQAVSMLAESLIVDGETTVDGGDAMTKEEDWGIWEEDAE